MPLTDEELDALAERLWRASDRAPIGCDAWDSVAREAARWADEQERERLEPLRVAVEAVKSARQTAFEQTDPDKVRLANITYRSALGILEGAARRLLEQTE